jgi:hypothetical protein
MLQTSAAVLLVVVPLAFNGAFFALARAFDYPDILRRPADEILRRFHAGGAGLILRWEALLLSALAMVPLVVLLALCLDAAPTWTVLSIVLGAVAGLVQGLGLVRWPFAVPELARRYVALDDPAVDPAGAAAERRAIETTFATMHRLLGVGVGEHLGYLFTGLWTLTAAASIVTTTVLPAWLGWLGVPIGLAILVGTLEFVGPNERDGWALAGTVVPIAYLAWTAWLIALGVALLLA